MAHGRARSASCTACVRADRPVALELTPLCTWRSVHGERFADGDPGGRGDRGRLRLRGRVPRRGRRLAARRRLVPRRPRARGGGARPERPRGPLGGRHVRASSSAPGDAHEVTAAAAPFDGALPGGGRDRRRRPRARRGARARQARPRTTADAQLVLAADQFAITTAGRPDRRRRLPVVRRVVARPDDVVRGPLPRAPDRADEGREVLRRAAATRLGGDAREHRRHRHARVQHRRRDALVRPRARPPRRGHRRRRPRRRARAGRSTQIVAAPPRRARGSGSASTRPTACCGRAPTAGR